MENKHIEYPSMPFDIGDVVYYMKKDSEISGHSGYKIIKTKCAGYWNFGDEMESENIDIPMMNYCNVNAVFLDKDAEHFDTIEELYNYCNVGKYNK